MGEGSDQVQGCVWVGSYLTVLLSSALAACKCVHPCSLPLGLLSLQLFTCKMDVYTGSLGALGRQSALAYKGMSV